MTCRRCHREIRKTAYGYGATSPAPHCYHSPGPRANPKRRAGNGLSPDRSAPLDSLNPSIGEVDAPAVPSRLRGVPRRPNGVDFTDGRVAHGPMASD